MKGLILSQIFFLKVGVPINESSQLGVCRNYITPILFDTHHVLQVCRKSVTDFGTQHYCWGSLNHCQWDKATKLECLGTILPVWISKQSHWFAMWLSAPWATCSCARELLWALPGSTLKALNSYPGKIYSKLNTRVISQQSISRRQSCCHFYFSCIYSDVQI